MLSTSITNMLLLTLLSLACAADITTFYTFDVVEASGLGSLNRVLMYDEYKGTNYTTFDGRWVVPRMYFNSDNFLVTEEGASFNFNSWAMNLYFGSLGSPAGDSDITINDDGYLSYQGSIEFGLSDAFGSSFNFPPQSNDRLVYFKAAKESVDDNTTTTTTTTTTTGDTNTTTTTTTTTTGDTNTTATTTTTTTTSTYSLYLPTLPTDCDDFSDYLLDYPTELHSLLPSGFCSSVPGDSGVPTDTKTESKTVTETTCTEPACTGVPSEKGTKTESKTVTETVCTEPTCTGVAPKNAAPSKALAHVAAFVGIVANVFMI